MSNENKAANLFRLLQGIATEIDRDMPLTTAMVFARVAMAGPIGVDQGKLQGEIKASTAGISRTIQTLSHTHWMKDRAGLGLIERLMDASDNRRRTLKVTPKGVKLLDKCATAWEGRK